MNTVPCGDHRNIHFSHVQTKGSYHRQNQLPCEDVVLMRAARDHLFCGLADGQSGAKHGTEGGRFCRKQFLIILNLSVSGMY